MCWHWTIMTMVSCARRCCCDRWARVAGIGWSHREARKELRKRLLRHAGTRHLPHERAHVLQHCSLLLLVPLEMFLHFLHVLLMCSFEKVTGNGLKMTDSSGAIPIGAFLARGYLIPRDLSVLLCGNELHQLLKIRRLEDRILIQRVALTVPLRHALRILNNVAILITRPRGCTPKENARHQPERASNTTCAEESLILRLHVVGAGRKSFRDGLLIRHKRRQIRVNQSVDDHVIRIGVEMCALLKVIIVDIPTRCRGEDAWGDVHQVGLALLGVNIVDGPLDVVHRDVQFIELLLHLSAPEMENFVRKYSELLVQPADRKRGREQQRMIGNERDLPERIMSGSVSHRLCAAYDALYDTPSLPSDELMSLMTNVLKYVFGSSRLGNVSFSS